MFFPASPFYGNTRSAKVMTMDNRKRVILGVGTCLVLLGILLYAFTRTTRPPNPSVATRRLLSVTLSPPLSSVTPPPLLPSVTPPPPSEPSAAPQRPAKQKLSLGLRQGDRLMYEFFQHRAIKGAANASIPSMTTASAVLASVDITT